MLLILAGVTINLVIGQNGIVGRAKDAKEQTLIENYRERLQLISPALKVEKHTEGKTSKEIMDRYEEEIKKDDMFKESQVIRKDEETIQVITKEGYVYDITEDTVKYIGKEGQLQPPDLDESNIESKITPSGWTNQNVEVEISTKIGGYTLEYSVDENNWTEYTKAITMENNGAIYVRLRNGNNGVGNYATVNVTNIDKIEPTVSYSTKSVSTSTPTTPPTPSGGTIYTDSNGEKAPIPSGFKVSNTNGETVIQDGLVVKGPDESEFVWVPVKNPIASSESANSVTTGAQVIIIVSATDEQSGISNITNVTTSNITKVSNTEYKVSKDGDYTLRITDGAGNSKDITVTVKGTEIIQKAMAINLGTSASPKYRGLLYDFSGTSSTVKSGCTTTTEGYREPSYLVGEDGDDSTLNTVGITQQSLQNDYNAMITSVKKYGGFYIARYESSLNSDNKVQSKIAMPTTASDINSYTWFGLYEKQKAYANNINATSIQSSMIWGSQYDAMLNWMLTGKDAEKITATENGNHSNKLVNTGATITDKINNIYDLEGNLEELSLEANFKILRVARGGRYTYSTNAAGRYSSQAPVGLGVTCGSRFTLYLK